MKHTRSTTIVVLSIGLAAVLIGIGLVAWNIKTGSAAVATLQETLVQKEQEQVQESGLRTLVEETHDSITSLNDHLVDPKQIVDFIEFVESIGDSTGIPVVVDNVAEKSATVTLNVSGKGSWNQVNHLLVLIEHVPYELHVAEVSFERVDAGSVVTPAKRVSLWQVRMNVSVKTIAPQ